MTIINAKQGRAYNIGTKIMSDETIMFDMNEGNGNFTFGNIPIRELIEHLNTLEGVSATYTPPKVRREVPKGIGAVIALGENIRLTRVSPDTRNSWVQNSGEIASWYHDNAIDYYLNDSYGWNPVILSEGVTP